MLIAGLTYQKFTWITKPHLIVEHLLSKRNISINPKCYDDIESRANHRADWIADHHKKLQEEEEKRQIEAAELKLKLLDEKFEND